MTLKLLDTALVDNAGGDTTIALSSLVTLTATGNPTYLVVDALDRNEYTATSTGATGSFVGGGETLGLDSIGGDARGAGIVFTWQPSTGQYFNAAYGTLGALDFTDSTSPNDVINLSFFGTSNIFLAEADAGNAYALTQQDAAGYFGSATIATSNDFANPPPAEATPDGIAAAALAMVGQAWNEDGCWVLASTIAAEAGAGLPVQSTEIDKAGAANGEWSVLYNGPVSSNANWQSLVSAGDMVVFATSATSGHITTCVSGAGSTAMLVDNITYIGQGGAIQNSAHDGSASDITISAPHAAAQEFAGINPSSVVIYALDAPAISDKSATVTLTTGTTVSLATLVSATDPAHKPITAYEVYETGGTDSLLLGAKPVSASQASPITAASLSLLSLSAGSAPTNTTLEIRASNGTYWGDWQTLAIDTISPAPKPPVLEGKIAAQTWQQGADIAFTLPATLFKDPQGSATTLSASGLPAWLTFNPGTAKFSGTVPAGLEKFSLVVTATDALGEAASTSFAVSVPAAAPSLSIPEPAQTLAEHSAFTFALPTASFLDPQGEHLTYKATLSNGAALPSWLAFAASTLSFSGTTPKTVTALDLKITAIDTSGLSAMEIFGLSVAPASTGGTYDPMPEPIIHALPLPPPFTSALDLFLHP